MTAPDPALLELLRQMVAFDTVSTRTNVPMAEAVADRLDAAGWRVRLVRDRALGADKASLLAWLGPDADGGLVLSGHTDVVPYEGQPGWTRNPLVLGRDDERVYGRGVCDMKGFLALCVHLAERLDTGRLRRPLVLLFTCDEEEGCLGAGRLLPHLEALRGELPLPADCVIGEPTRFEVYRAHKGHTRARLVVTGRGGHSSRPDLGTNAIAAAAAAVREVEALAAEMPGRVDDDARILFPELPYVPFNLGTIAGGTADNMIAERCELVVAFRQAPGQDAAPLLAELEDRVRRVVASTYPGARVELGDVIETPSMVSPAHGPLLDELLRVAGAASAGGAPYATDGGQLARAGIRSYICGPGELEQAHQPDESLPLADLVRGLGLLEDLVAARCAGGRL
jgi:acetylornithine deacetylase